MKRHEFSTNNLPPLGSRERFDLAREKLAVARQSGNPGKISIAHAEVDRTGAAWFAETNYDGERPPASAPDMTYQYYRGFVRPEAEYATKPQKPLAELAISASLNTNDMSGEIDIVRLCEMVQTPEVLPVPEAPKYIAEQAI